MNIAANLNDFAWMDEVDGSEGAIFFAAGMLHYFTFAQAEALAHELSVRFAGDRFVFDMMGKLGKRLMRKTFKGFGMENYDDCLCVNKVDEIRSWCPGARISHRGYMLGYQAMDDPNVKGIHRFLARLCDGLVNM